MLWEPALCGVGAGTRRSMRTKRDAAILDWLSGKTAFELAELASEVRRGPGIISLAVALATEMPLIAAARKHVGVVDLTRLMHRDQFPPWLVLANQYPGSLDALCIIDDLERMTLDEYVRAMSARVNTSGGLIEACHDAQALDELALRVEHFRAGRTRGRKNNADLARMSKEACRAIALDYLVRIDVNAAEGEIFAHVRRSLDGVLLTTGKKPRSYADSVLKKYLGLRLLRHRARLAALVLPSARY